MRLCAAAYIELIEDGNAPLKELVGHLLRHGEVVEGSHGVWGEVVAHALHDAVCQPQVLQLEGHPEERVGYFQCCIPLLPSS